MFEVGIGLEVNMLVFLKLCCLRIVYFMIIIDIFGCIQMVAPNGKVFCSISLLEVQFVKVVLQIDSLIVEYELKFETSE
jgi:hypothetical protein